MSVDLPVTGVRLGESIMRGRGPARAALILTCMPLLLLESTARADGIDVTISNDGTQNLVVTVYDMNSLPKRAVLTNARINGFSSLSISLVTDASGKGRLSWTATSTDPTFPKCGHSDQTVDNAGSVSVRADSSCSA
jgi:hypothetical protein